MGLPWGRLEGVRPSKELHRFLDQGLDVESAWRMMQQQRDISREKFDLLWRVAQVERPILAESTRDDLFSVYVGIPFCPTRCLYCSFPSHSLKELGTLRGRFVDTLLREIEATGKLTKRLGLRPYTFYVGGGTPTALTPTDLDRILSALCEAFPGPLREFTVEAGRPDTVTIEHLAVLRKHGVDRVSVNPQTMHEATLQTIGRCHSTHDVYQSVSLVRQAEFPILNMDVILGLPGEDVNMVSETVKQVVGLQPENITVHMFSRKRASRYTEERDLFSLPDANQATAMVEAASSLLMEKYIPYYLYRQREILGGQENIGYCLPQKVCVYNIVMIEERHHIFGLGGGATSKLIHQDTSLTNVVNPKDVRVYLQRMESLCRQREQELCRTL
jgi:oxygen-independent coproporphyrinogen-3 oxidase